MKETADHLFVPDFAHRYLTEDAPYGLVVIRGVAEIVQVATPTIDRVLLWAQEKIGKEYLVRSKLQGKDAPSTRAPQRYGLNAFGWRDAGFACGVVETNLSKCLPNLAGGVPAEVKKTACHKDEHDKWTHLENGYAADFEGHGERWVTPTVKEEGTGLRWKFTSKLEDLDFADDVALISSTQRHMQLKTNRLVENAERTGLRVNVGKCKVLRVNAKNNEAITVNGLALEDVEKFIYLGATVCKQRGGEEDIKARLGKARGAFVKLNRVWDSSSVSRKTKIRLYKTMVKPVLMYGCESWKMNEGDAKKIDVFQNRCLRRIMKIKWQDKISNRELLERANVERLSKEVRRRRWRFIGHILRQQPDNDCVTALTWTPEGKRKRGRPKTTWRRTVEKERSKAGWQSWREVRTAARQESMESTCEGPMRQLGARGQVK
ncbi:hypothetical protein ACROYT_G018376 [Oculina patagonica]